MNVIDLLLSIVIGLTCGFGIVKLLILLGNAMHPVSHNIRRRLLSNDATTVFAIFGVVALMMLTVISCIFYKRSHYFALEARELNTRTHRLQELMSRLAHLMGDLFNSVDTLTKLARPRLTRARETNGIPERGANPTSPVVIGVAQHV